ncbi:MAG: flagellar basal body P-ring formation chaperone FlgA [Pseudomonadota bacterium]
MRGLACLAAVCTALPLAAEALAEEVLARHTLRPGEVVTADDLRAGDGLADAAAAMVGLEVRRAVYAGRPIAPADLGPPTLIERNAIVTMTYRAGALAIRTEGRALDAGGEGERIRVMNLTSRQWVPAVVRGHGLVEVSK